MLLIALIVWFVLLGLIYRRVMLEELEKDSLNKNDFLFVGLLFVSGLIVILSKEDSVNRYINEFTKEIPSCVITMDGTYKFRSEIEIIYKNGKFLKAELVNNTTNPVDF